MGGSFHCYVNVHQRVQNESSAWNIGRYGGRDGADMCRLRHLGVLWIAEVLCEWEFTSPCQQQSWNSWALQWILGQFSYLICGIFHHFFCNSPGIFVQHFSRFLNNRRIGVTGLGGQERLAIAPCLQFLRGDGGVASSSQYATAGDLEGSVLKRLLYG